MLGGIDINLLALGEQLAGERVYLLEALNLIAPERYAHCKVFVGGLYLQRIAADAETPAAEIYIVTLVLHFHQLAYDAVPALFLALLEAHHEAVILLRLSQTIDTGDRGHDNDITAHEQGAGRGVAQLVYLLVYIHVFLYVGIRARDICFGLVIIVVADEVLHSALGKEVPELGAELGSQRFVVSDDKRGALHALDDIGHGEGLAAAGHAEESLLLIVLLKPLDKPFRCLGLVAGEFEIGDDFERRHDKPYQSERNCSFYYTSTP